MKLVTHNRNNDNDNIDIDVPNDVGRDNLTSTLNDRENGRISPTESNSTIIDIVPIRDTTIEEEGADLMPPQKSYDFNDYDVVFAAPARQLSHENREPSAFSGDNPRANPTVTQPPEKNTVQLMTQVKAISGELRSLHK